ncbi:hypothetical protein RI543_000981 [Arxiozyma heterogenica]|uniref:Uncharacterized protein n=1 Tax=Arxiozyma heterogenica TaxID=278026 RepID=A0AAN7WPK4_9SACH|nr:hypothetical protein RI543_000981 [Kazachstania heterogenica]
MTETMKENSTSKVTAVGTPTSLRIFKDSEIFVSYLTYRKSTIFLKYLDKTDSIVLQCENA